MAEALHTPMEIPNVPKFLQRGQERPDPLTSRSFTVGNMTCTKTAPTKAWFAISVILYE